MTSASPHPPRTPYSARLRRRVALALLVLGALCAGAWRYQITRPEYRFARGEEALRAGNAEVASSYADRLEASGHPDRAHLLRGEALRARGAPGAALAQLNKVQSGGDLRLRAALLSGRCLLDLGELKEAYRAFQFVAAERQDDADAHRGLAAITYDLGRLGEAVEHLRRVAELDAGDPRPHRLIGLIYKDMGQDALAEGAYRESLRRGPPPADARAVRVELAEVLARRGKFAEGLEALDGAPEDAGDDAAVARAECLRGLGRLQEAAEGLDAALARQPTTALYRLRGQVYRDQGRPLDAVRCFERATELGPADHQSQYLLGQAYAGVGRKEESARAFGRAEELRRDLERITTLSKEAMASPWDAPVRLQLAELSERLVPHQG